MTRGSRADTDRVTRPSVRSDVGFDLSDVDAVGRLFARVRRLADLSQRELAARVGVTQNAIARVESGDGLPSLVLLARVLAVGALRVSLTDAAGSAISPVPDDLVRDNAGRRFPAHLDVAPPDEVPYERWAYPRYDRPAARGWYQLRPARDRDAADRVSGRPDDHPTAAELETRVRLMAGPQPRVAPVPVPLPECECLDECFETWCLDACPCRCEPPPASEWDRRRLLSG
ncbi:helix-turn-helix transcriptional regulator [Intrasporangium sp. YIM S08009]|uniref:helix-turn-helix domain-containing protein n=1 Tax=Intrasporangium zincisolvens TaxID=3080018 RepID=UPI002B055D80|nr:helix-turn-helix transcriptional regulator [Intrasporangium sp. YIM S08009]